MGYSLTCKGEEVDPAVLAELQLTTDALAEIVVLSTDQRVRTAFPYHTAEQMVGLIRDQPLFVDTLMVLPQTLCQKAFFRQNRPCPGKCANALASVTHSDRPAGATRQ